MNRLKANETSDAVLSFIFDDKTPDSDIHPAGMSIVHSSPDTPNTNTSISQTRSGLVRIRKSTNSIHLQTDLFEFDQPPVMKAKVCTDEVNLL